MRTLTKQGLFNGTPRSGELHWTDSEGRQTAGVAFAYEPDEMQQVLRLSFSARRGEDIQEVEQSV